MPWKIFREGERFCVHKLNADDSKGEKVACHDSQEAAEAQMRALYANVKEFRGAFTDILAITELRGQYPNVPLAADVDYEGLIAEDTRLGTTPVFITVPIGKANVTSGNKRHYDEAFLQELERQTLSNKPVGLMGHLSETERATAFPPEAVHWVGAIRDGDTLWGKGYIPPGAVRDRIQRYKAQGKAIATSIDAFAEGVWDETLKAMRMAAKSLRLNQIDIAPADRAGIPDLAAVPLLTTEMDAPETDRQQEPITMAEKQEVLQELRKTPVQPHGTWTPQEPAEAPELVAIRETLGASADADLPKLVRELQERVQEQEKAAVKARITELVNEGIKVESVRGLVTELVVARNPQTPEEAAQAVQQVLEMQSVKETLEATVQRIMGPRQTTPIAPRQGTNKYFNIPQEA